MVQPLSERGASGQDTEKKLWQESHLDNTKENWEYVKRKTSTSFDKAP